MIFTKIIIKNFSEKLRKLPIMFFNKIWIKKYFHKTQKVAIFKLWRLHYLKCRIPTACGLIYNINLMEEINWETKKTNLAWVWVSLILRCMIKYRLYQDRLTYQDPSDQAFHFQIQICKVFQNSSLKNLETKSERQKSHLCSINYADNYWVIYLKFSFSNLFKEKHVKKKQSVQDGLDWGL